MTELSAIFFFILLTVSLTSCFRRDTDLLRYIVTMRNFGGNDGALHDKTATKTETKRSVQQRCSVRNIYCHNCINFSTIIQADLIYSIVQQQNVELKVKNVKCVTQKFLGFFPPAQPENRKHSTKS